VEHRWGERLSVRTRVAIRTRGGSQGIGYLRDVSMSGALLPSGVRASLMSRVRVFFTEGPFRGGLSIEGEVVRFTEDGFAVEWRELAPEVVRSLTQAESSADARVNRNVILMVKIGSAGR
jgi:PilZ domain-containing protein